MAVVCLERGRGVGVRDGAQVSAADANLKADPRLIVHVIMHEATWVAGDI